MKIEIFENKNKKIDLSKLIDSRMICMANSGAGKSYLVRKILEETHGKVLSIILDFEGEFKTLREKYDYLLIGEDGDVEISLNSAKILPKKLLELNVPTIIDISDFKRPDRVKYVKLFLEGLMEAKRDLWKPCLVVLDEIHNLAGQQEKQDSCASVIDLATRGRKRGFALIGVTQRISKLHKDVVAELNNYCVGRTSLDIDMKRSADILGFNSKQDMLSLRDLDDGEFFVFGPAISRTIEKEKVGLSKTTHPKQGQDIKEVVIQPSDKVKSIISKLNELPKEQVKELKELNDYKNEIIRLKREVSLRPKEQLVKEVKVVDERALNKAREQGFREAQTTLQNHVKAVENQFRAVSKKLENIAKIIGQEIKVDLPKLQNLQMKVSESKPIRKDPPMSKKFYNPREEIPIFEENSLNKCERSIYSLLVENPDRGFTKTQIGLLTGYSHKSGGFNNSLYSLNAKNLIRKEGNIIFVGEINLELAESGIKYDKENLIRKLPKCPREIFKVLLENPYEEYNKEELANVTGYSANSGGFNNSVYKLNSLELIQKVGNTIKLNPEVLEL